MPMYAEQSQKAVFAAYFASKQILLFGFTEQICCMIPKNTVYLKKLQLHNFASTNINTTLNNNLSDFKSRIQFIRLFRNNSLCWTRVKCSFLTHGST